MENVKRKKFYSLLIFCFVLLINPNVNVVDIMPDFIAWFILAKLFERASYAAPYFEEARSAFLKLGWLNLAKILGLFVIIFVKGKDSFDNNIYTLVSFSFAVGEVLLLIPAIKNIFAALFRLGERTEAEEFISPFNAPIFKMHFITPDALKNFTYLFFITKTVCYAVPDMFLLTSVSDKGQIISVSKYFPYVLLVSVLACTFIGIVWFLITKSYAFRIYSTGKFADSIDSLQTTYSSVDAKNETKLHSILTSLTLLSLSSVFSIELVFDNWNSINILPHFIYGIFLSFSFYRLKKYTNFSSLTYISGAVFSLFATVTHFLSASFLSQYVYLDLIDNRAAQGAYLPIMIFAALEFISLAVFLVFTARAMNAFVYEHTGVSPESEHYMKTEKDYHKSLKTRNFILVGIAMFAGLSKCVNVFLNRNIRPIYTDITKPVISASVLPWFNLVVAASAIAYIGFSFYYTSILKEEVKIKYGK